MSLANWFSTIYCIFICSFPDIHLFLINCNLFRFLNRLWTFPTHFYSSTNRFCLFILAYQSLLLVSTRLPFTSRFYSFTIYQSLLLVYESFLLVSTNLTDVFICLPAVSHFSAYSRNTCNFLHKWNLLLKNFKVLYLVRVVGN